MASTNKMIQNATAKNLTATGKPSMQQYIKQMEAEIKKYATISDDEFNEILFGRVTKRIVVYPEKRRHLCRTRSM